METALQSNQGDMRASASLASDQQRKLTNLGRQILVDAMKNSNRPYTAVLRENVVRALGKQPTLSELEQAVLEAVLQDSDAEVRVHAALSLSQHRKLPEAGRQVLVDAVKNHNGPYTVALRAHAALALGEQATLSESEQTVLEAALQDNEAEVRARAAAALDQHRKLTEFSYLIH